MQIRSFLKPSSHCYVQASEDTYKALQAENT